MTLHRHIAAVAAVIVIPQVAHAQTTVGGVAYAQLGYSLAKDTLAADSTLGHVNNFDITRAYINVTGRFPAGVVTRVTADIFNSGGSRLYRLKYGYVAYTPDSSHFTYVLGQLQTPLLEWEEALWDYRMQGQMAMERGGYMSSSDIGFGVDGKWGPDNVNMQLAFVNGESYSGGPGDQRKDIQGRVSVRALMTDDSSRVGGLRFTAYGGYGKPTGSGQRNRFLGMVSYRTKHITLAGEFASTKDSSFTAPTPSTTGRVISAFGVYKVPNSKVAVIARVYITDPNTSAANNKTTRIIGGLSYQLSPNLRLLLDLDNLSYEGTPTPAQEAVRSQALFQTQITF